MMRQGNFGRPGGNFRGHPGNFGGGRQQGNMNNRNQGNYGRFQQGGGFQGNNYGRHNQGQNNKNASQSPAKREPQKVASSPTTTPKPVKQEESKQTPKTEQKQDIKTPGNQAQSGKKETIVSQKDVKTSPAQSTKKDEQVKTPQNGTQNRKTEGPGQQQQKQQQKQHQGGFQQQKQFQKQGQDKMQNQEQKHDKQGNMQNQRPKQQFKPKERDYNFTKTDSDTKEDKKFTGRCRLFVGNLTPDVTEEEFRKMFEQFGEISEPYVSPGRGFGFVRLDFRHNAEAAKAALDGMTKNGRVLRVRFATHGAALKVKNLHPYVSNELLEESFGQFGDLERAVVIVDDRGKSTGEGIVEFERKPGAQAALRRINEGIFLLGTTPRPVIVEPLEQTDEDDGLSERFMNKNEGYKTEREKEPRFAMPGSFEYEFAQRWREIDELEKERIDRVKKDMEDARARLEDEMQGALIEYQAEQIRKDLLRQQEELRRLEEMRQQDVMRRQQDREMRQREEDRIRAEEDRRLKEMMMPRHGGPMEQGGRRREEMMGGMRDGPGPRGMKDGAPPLPPPPAPPAGMGLDRSGRPNQMQGGMGGNFSGSSNMGNSGHSSMGGGSNSGGMGSMPRQSRFDQPSGNFEGGFQSGGGMGGPMGGPGGNMGGPGGPGSMFNNQGMGGNSMGGGGPGMRGDGMDRRREGGPREDFGEVKRMRRY